MRRLLLASASIALALIPAAAWAAYDDAPMVSAGADIDLPLREQPGFERINLPLTGAGPGGNGASAPAVPFTPLGVAFNGSVALGAPQSDCPVAAYGRPISLTAQTGFYGGGGIGPVLTIPAGKSLCLITTGVGINFSGWLTYAQFAG